MNPTFSRATARAHHREEAGRSRSRAFFTATGTTIAGLVVAIVLAVTTAGGSYAYLSQSAQAMPNTTVVAGTAALVASPLALPTTPMFPGATLRGAVTVTNDGDVPLALRVAGLNGPSASNTFTQALTLAVGVVTSVTQCTNGSAVTARWSGTFASSAAASLATTLAVKSAAGSSVILCISVSLPTTAPSTAQGQSALNFEILIDGTQA